MKMETNTVLKCLVIFAGLSSVASTKLDLAFLLDSWPTSYLNPVNEDSVKDLIRNTYGSFQIGDNGTHVALITSGKTAKIEFDFNAGKDFESLDDYVDGFVFPQTPSNLGKALDLANYGLFRNSGRPDAVKVLLVIAKNKSTDDIHRAARSLKQSGVRIVSVGIGEESLYRDDLENIVSPPKRYNSIFVDSSSTINLAPILVKRIQELVDLNNISAPTAIEEPSEPSPSAQCSKKCEKEVSGEKIPINCNNCKLAGCCNLCCNRDENRPFYSGPVALTFLLDESGELQNWNNFETMKAFMRNLTRNFDTSSKKTKLGIVSFSRDNVQIHDLGSYHERARIDSQIDKLNYEGTQTYSGHLNKGLEAALTNLFSEARDLSVPRVLLVFDSGTIKDDQTEVKAFKLQSSDVQTFCIGLGTTYDKEQCEKMVEKPAEKHSLSAQVTQLGELRETITLMIVNDIAEKYCPFCAQGITDACRPCKTARHYMGTDKALQAIKPANILKIMSNAGKAGGQNLNLKSAPKLHIDEEENDDDDGDDTTSQRKGSKNAGTDETSSQDGGQIGTSLPNVELVKDLLQTGVAPDSGQTAQIPLVASSQPGPSQQSFVLPQQQLMPNAVSPQFAMQQPMLNQDSLMQPQNTLANMNPFQGSPLNAFTSNSNSGGTLDPTAHVQPVVLDPSLLSQAILGNGKFQGNQKRISGNTERKHMNAGSPPNRLPAPSVQVSDSTTPNDLSSFQAGPLNPGVTPSMPILPATFRQQTEVQDNVPPQFQSLLPPGMRTPGSDSTRISQQNKKPLFEDEYKYDQFDKQGPFTMECRDLSDNCESYATEGGCEEYAPLSEIGEVRTMCKKSCGLCDMNAENVNKKSQTKQKGRSHKKTKKH